MFERCTDRARKAMALARKSARDLRHDFLGPEHILLGSIAVDDGAAARILEELGADADRVRRGIEARLPPGSGPASQPRIPFTPEAKRVLETALEAASTLGHDHIGTEHLLLGLCFPVFLLS